MTEKYYFDTDCLSAFLWVREQSILASLYSGRIILPAQVYNEIARVPHLQARIDVLKNSGDLRVESMEVGSEEYYDYLRMTTSPEKGMRIIGNGEAAGIGRLENQRVSHRTMIYANRRGKCSNKPNSLTATTVWSP